MTDEKKKKDEKDETLSETISKVMEDIEKKNTLELDEEEDNGGSEEISEGDDSREDEDGDAHSDEEEESEDDSGEEEEDDDSAGKKSDEEDEEKLHVATIEAPSSWSDTAKQEFSELPPRQKENIVKAFKGMQADYTQKLQGISQVVQALAPIHEECVESGTTYATAIARMVGAHVQLKKNPAEAFRGLMQLYNVTPQQVLGIKEEGEEIPASVQKRISDLEAQVSQSRKMTETELLEKNKTEVLEFAKTAEFFTEVEAEMGNMAEAAAAAGQPVPTLKELYDRACWVVPSVREKMLAKDREDRNKDRINERKERVAKSRKASKVSKRSAAPPGKSDSKEVSLRDEIEMNYNASVGHGKKAASGR